MSRAWALVAVVSVGAVAAARPQVASVPAPPVVEVVGQVSGLVQLAPDQTAADAVRALGGTSERVHRPVQDGDRVRVLANGQLNIESGDDLLFGHRVDLNRAGPQGLMALPGVGSGKARSVASARPYAAEADVVRARGIGQRAAAEIGPLVHTRHAPEPPVVAPCNINDADALALERLSGVGPVLSRRIVAERDTAGPFERESDLERVHGIGPLLAARVSAQVVFE